MEITFGYITTPTLEEARRIGKILVEERLAACVNLFPQMESWYRWKGQMEVSQEVVLIAKTRAGLRQALQDRVLALHPYECPCIVFLPIAQGNQDYLNWILKETASG